VHQYELEEFRDIEDGLLRTAWSVRFAGRRDGEMCTAEQAADYRFQMDH